MTIADGGDWVNAPVSTALRGVRGGGLHGRPEGEGESETPRRRSRGGKEGEDEGEACAQGEIRIKDRVGKRLLAARATGAAFGADSRGVATLPVVMLRVP